MPFRWCNNCGGYVDHALPQNIPRANTNLTCVLIGERVAGWLRQERLPRIGTSD
jgi:hypothetical protein